MIVYTNSPGHMTKMAAMSMYCKKSSKYSTLETKDQLPRNLFAEFGWWSCQGCSNAGPKTTLLNCFLMSLNGNSPQKLIF